MSKGYETNFEKNHREILASTFRNNGRAHVPKNILPMLTKLNAIDNTLNECDLMPPPKIPAKSNFNDSSILPSTPLPRIEIDVNTFDAESILNASIIHKSDTPGTFSPSMSTMEHDFMNPKLNTSSFLLDVSKEMDNQNSLANKMIRKSFLNAKIVESTNESKRNSVDSFAFEPSKSKDLVKKSFNDSFDFTMEAKRREFVPENNLSSTIFNTQKSPSFNMQTFKNTKKRQLSLSPTNSSVSSNYPNISNSEKVLKVFIRNASRDDVLTKDDFKMVMRLLMKKYESADDGVTFQGNGFKDGFGWIQCSNKMSSDWLLETIPKIQRNIPNVQVRASNTNREMTKAVVVIPCEVDEQLSPETLFKRLAKSNPGLCTNEWEVTSEDRGFSSVAFNLLIDKKSVKILRKLNYKPCYVFERVFFNVNEFL